MKKIFKATMPDGNIVTRKSEKDYKYALWFKTKDTGYLVTGLFTDVRRKAPEFIYGDISRK